MKLSIVLLLCLVISAKTFVVYSQSEILTPEEQKAVETIRDRFNEGMAKEGRIEPLIPQMFVADVGVRYAKEAQADPMNGPLILLTPGIQFKREVLADGTEEDWRHALTATFNLGHIIGVPMLNRTIVAAKTGKQLDDMEGDLDKLISKPVIDLFAKDPVLSNYLEKKGTDTPIATVEDLRRVAATLDKGRDMISANLPPADRQLSAETASMLKTLMNNKDFGPTLGIAERETYGFPRGTRFISFFANPMEALLITRVGADYKIVSAQISSPD